MTMIPRIKKNAKKNDPISGSMIYAKAKDTFKAIAKKAKVDEALGLIEKLQNRRECAAYRDEIINLREPLLKEQAYAIPDDALDAVLDKLRQIWMKAVPNSEQAPTEEEEEEMVGKFGKSVEEIRTRDGCSRVDAMRKARRENPEAYAVMQTAPTRLAKANAVNEQAQLAVIRKGAEFRTSVQKAVRERAAQDKCSNMEAIKRLRREQPELFA